MLLCVQMRNFITALVAIICLLIQFKTADSSFNPLQVQCFINGFNIAAVIDTAAEISVMSAQCAKRLQISDYINKRYSGTACGVGTTEIIGRIDDLKIDLGEINFRNKVSVLKNSRCDFILGLDFLKRHKSKIDMENNCIRLGNRKIPFVQHSNKMDADMVASSKFFEDDDVVDEPRVISSFSSYSSSLGLGKGSKNKLQMSSTTTQVSQQQQQQQQQGGRDSSQTGDDALDALDDYYNSDYYYDDIGPKVSLEGV